MPTASRPRQSVVVLALVMGVLAFAPTGVGASSTSDVAASLMAAAREAELAANALAVAAAEQTTDPSTVVGAMTLAQREARAAWLLRTRPPTAGSKAVAGTGATASSSSASGSGRTTRYVGRNHVWIPALGVNRSITFYPCSSSFYPGNRVYRWGCAGSNNVYLFGHAFSVFKPLHDAYVSGRLRKGMRVYYANASGTVATYAVSWWKLTTPDAGGWAFAAQSTPSLTLQTCVGSKSQYRLIVRLRKIG
jgi:hypothetical protein